MITPLIAGVFVACARISTARVVCNRARDSWVKTSGSPLEATQADDLDAFVEEVSYWPLQVRFAPPLVRLYERSPRNRAVSFM